tara:strand:+ start:307 stop:708 length:402 start_codon:yes stop_codon:yes gene_type:complete
MSKLVIDTIEGKTSASTVNIKTNSITTNLQDVVPKFFACYGTVSSTAIINSHSLNMSSLTDNNTGGTIFTLTVNHATSTYPLADAGGDGAGGYATWMLDDNHTSSTVRTGLGDANFASQDGTFHSIYSYGDLV